MLKAIQHRAQSQQCLFASIMNWEGIIRNSLPAGDVSCKICVLRNHNFEIVSEIVKQYLRFGGLEVDFSIHEYDNTFAFRDAENADLVLIWMEDSLYKISADELSFWFANQCEKIVSRCNIPIIAAVWSDNEERRIGLSRQCKKVAGIDFFDLYSSLQVFDAHKKSARMVEIGGTPLSKTAQMLSARELARLIGGHILPPIKAIAVDLDDTMHKGILGEDKVSGIVVTEKHEILHRQLLKCKEQGILLVLVTHNEDKDVRNMFASGYSSCLRLQDFAFIAAGWQSKAEYLQQAAEYLRISVDSFVFVDDNPGEIVAMAAQLPQVKLIVAEADASITARTIEFFPGLSKVSTSKEDSLRLKDLQVQQARRQIAQNSVDENDYFASLSVSLHFHLNSVEQVKRLDQLSMRTNQFNLSLSRINQVEISALIEDPCSDVVSVALVDYLSDSGIICMVAGVLKVDVLVIEEACISCRALGRGLENSMILGAIKIMENFKKCKRVAFKYTVGPRNQPALAWLESLAGNKDTLATTKTFSKDRVSAFEIPPSIKTHVGFS